MEKIQDLKSLSTGSLAVLGNASGNLTFDGIELSPSGRKAGFIFLLDEFFKEEKEIFFDSNLEAVISSMALDEEQNIYVLGHFKNNLLVGQKIYFSNGGYDLFLAKAIT